MRLRCTNCSAAFEGEKSEGCPKCLRRTSVIEAMDGPIAVAGEGHAPWPAGTTCSLCLERAVSDATYQLDLAKPGSGDSGGHHEWTTIRCRCCDPCRERVLALPRLRRVVLPFVGLGIAFWIFSIASTIPMRVFGSSRIEAGMLATLVSVIIVAVPLIVLDRANHALRGKLETSWLLRRLQERLGHPGGALAHELWRVVPEASGSANATDAADILRS